MFAKIKKFFIDDILTVDGLTNLLTNIWEKKGYIAKSLIVDYVLS